MLINRVGDFTHSISTFYNNAISYKFIHDFIVYIEGQASLIRHDSDKQALKASVSADIGKQMINVGILFLKELRVCFCKMRQRNRFGFRYIQFLGENLRAPINEEGLPSRLFVNSSYN